MTGVREGKKGVAAGRVRCQGGWWHSVRCACGERACGARVVSCGIVWSLTGGRGYACCARQSGSAARSRSHETRARAGEASSRMHAADQAAESACTPAAAPPTTSAPHATREVRCAWPHARAATGAPWHRGPARRTPLPAGCRHGDRTRTANSRSMQRVGCCFRCGWCVGHVASVGHMDMIAAGGAHVASKVASSLESCARRRASCCCTASASAVCASCLRSNALATYAGSK